MSELSAKELGNCSNGLIWLYLHVLKPHDEDVRVVAYIPPADVEVENISTPQVLGLVHLEELVPVARKVIQGTVHAVEMIVGHQSVFRVAHDHDDFWSVGANLDCIMVLMSDEEARRWAAEQRCCVLLNGFRALELKEGDFDWVFDLVLIFHFFVHQFQDL